MSVPPHALGVSVDGDCAEPVRWAALLGWGVRGVRWDSMWLDAGFRSVWQWVPVPPFCCSTPCDKVRYRSEPLTRHPSPSLCLAAQATISQESAAEEPSAAMLQLRGLGLEGNGWGGGGEPQSVDEVLAEVDAALAAAEEALERGRSPSPPAWPSMGNHGNSGSGASPPAISGGSDSPALGGGAAASTSAVRGARAKLSGLR